MPDDIPAFLRLTAAERRATWKDRKLTVMSRSKAKRDWHLPATIDAAGRALARQIEKDRVARAKARLAALKETIIGPPQRRHER